MSGGEREASTGNDDRSQPALDAGEREERDTLEQLRRAARALALPPVPPELTRTLRGIFRNRRADGRLEAVLAHDSRSRGDLAGVRSGVTADADVGGWSLGYRSPVGDLVVDVWARDDGQYDVDLQILVPDASLATFEVSLSGPVERRVVSDAPGRVALGTLPLGTYTLVVANGGIEIVCDVTVSRSR